MKKIDKACAFLTLTDDQIQAIKDYCGIEKKVILNHREQLNLFGVVIVRGVTTVKITDCGVNFPDIKTTYSWHGIASLLIKELINEYEDAIDRLEDDIISFEKSYC